MSARTTGEIERDAQLLATLRRIADALDAIHGTLAAFLDLANGACDEVAAAPAESVPDKPPYARAQSLVAIPPRLEYVGGANICDATTGDLVSPRVIVENYNAMRKGIWGNIP